MRNNGWKELFNKRLLSFSVSIIKLANKLPKTPAGFAIAGQVIRAATSIGANFGEAQDASSHKDFIQKLSISLREGKETLYWLQVIEEAQLLLTTDTRLCIKECDERVSVLVSSVKSAKAKSL